MSWGERSCIFAGTGKCPNPEISTSTCNVYCKYYKWDGKTRPDSGHHKKQSEILPEKKVYKTPTKNQIKRLKKKGKLK